MSPVRFDLPFYLLLLFITACQSQQLDNCWANYSDYLASDVCGVVTVPLDHDNPGSEQIEIPYLIIKSKSNTPKPDPVVFIQGGPGGGVLPFANNYSRLVLDPDRDLILYDQRGTGSLHPLCPGLRGQLMEILAMDLSPEEERKILLAELQPCGQSIDHPNQSLEYYNTIASAHDLEDLRQHLGYPTWNLFGGSYGTRLALTYARLYPDFVRTAVLVGLFPPELDMYDRITSNFAGSLDKVFKACETDRQCQSKYPDLSQTFSKTFEQLQKTPLRFNWNGEDFNLNAQDFLLLTHQLLYDRRTIGRVPAFITAIHQGKGGLARDVVNQVNQRLSVINLAVYWSVMAGDEGQKDNKTKLKRDLERNPSLQSGISLFLSDPFILANWREGAKPLEKPEVTDLDIPMLLVSGAFDPITPPRNAQAAAKKLSNAQQVIFNQEGHTSFNACFFEIANAFLQDPTVKSDKSCVKGSPAISWE